MALGGTDLNLLLPHKVLLEEGSVTRAGHRLELSQPAMSAARLRRRFDDELLVRAGRDYELTPLARDLHRWLFARLDELADELGDH